MKCHDCPAPALPGGCYCALHRAYHREYECRRRRRRKAKGLCCYCAAPATYYRLCGYHRAYRERERALRKARQLAKAPEGAQAT